MAETFDFPFELGAGGDEAPRTRQVSFGDGYQQSIEDGINTLQVSWGITISGDHVRIIAARDFLRRHAGVRWFWWRPPLEQSPIKVKCKRWRPVHTSTTSASLALTLERVYNPGA